MNEGEAWKREGESAFIIFAFRPLARPGTVRVCLLRVDVSRKDMSPLLSRNAASRPVWCAARACQPVIFRSSHISAECCRGEVRFTTAICRVATHYSVFYHFQHCPCLERHTKLEGLKEDLGYLTWQFNTIPSHVYRLAEACSFASVTHFICFMIQMVSLDT
jgi:hypothetical protein